MDGVFDSGQSMPLQHDGVILLLIVIFALFDADVLLLLLLYFYLFLLDHDVTFNDERGRYYFQDFIGDGPYLINVLLTLLLCLLTVSADSTICTSLELFLPKFENDLLACLNVIQILIIIALIFLVQIIFVF